MKFLLLTATLCTTVLACQAPETGVGAVKSAPEARLAPELELSRPGRVVASFKERLDQTYVYLELRGSYTRSGRLLEQVHAQMLAQKLAPAGPPFVLFYDDPGTVAEGELRSRACIPVGPDPKVQAPLQVDVLESATVAYAIAGGPYPEAPRCYPGIYAFMAKMGWSEHGPIREIYLVSPASVTSYDELLCEIQIPVIDAR